MTHVWIVKESKSERNGSSPPDPFPIFASEELAQIYVDERFKLQYDRLRSYLKGERANYTTLCVQSCISMNYVCQIRFHAETNSFTQFKWPLHLLEFWITWDGKTEIPDDILHPFFKHIYEPKWTCIIEKRPIIIS